MEIVDDGQCKTGCEQDEREESRRTDRGPQGLSFDCQYHHLFCPFLLEVRLLPTIAGMKKIVNHPTEVPEKREQFTHGRICMVLIIAFFVEGS